MNKKDKKYLQKYATLGLAAMLISSPLSQTALVYAEGEQTESTDEPVQTTAPSGTSQTETEKTNSMAKELKNQTTTISDDAVFQVRIGYEFDDGSFDEWARGSGFLIGDKYLVTSQTLADVSVNSSLYSKIVDAKKDAYKKVGIVLTDAKTTEKHIKIYITNTNGDKLEYKKTISKNGMGVIILKKAATTPICVFASESKLSFAADDTVNLKYAGKDDSKAVIQTSEGKIFTPEDSESAKAGFYFKADTTTGNALGAPVYNGNGNITGMVSAISSQDETSITALDQTAVQTFLSSNSIDYKTLAQVQKEQKVAEEKQAREDAEAAQGAVAKTKKLKEALKNAEGVERKLYTAESLKDMDNAVEKGQKILSSRAKTQAQVDTAAKNINKAMDKLVRKNIFQRMLSGDIAVLACVGGVIAAIAAIVAAIVLKKKKGKVKVDKKGSSTPAEDDEKYGYSEDLRRMEETDLKEQRHINENAENIRKAKEEKEREEAGARRATQENNTASEEAAAPGRDIYSDFEDDDFDDFDKDIDVTTRVKPKTDRVPGNAMQNGITYAEGVDDDGVSILDDDDGSEDTTVLGRNRLPKGYLIRIDNGKRIDITKDNFLIGKERKKVDYCIGGDSSVSRIHAMIRIIQGGFYIEDQDSTNYTFVNNNQIPAYKAVYIQDGSIIRISDVEFEFHEK